MREYKQGLFYLCGDDSAKRREVLRRDDVFNGINDILVRSESNINNFFEASNGIFKTASRTIFGHILKYWDDITSALDASEQVTLMQRLVLELGANPYLRKKSGKYSFEYIADSHASRQVIEHLLFVELSSVNLEDIDNAIISILGYDGKIPSQKDEVLKTLQAIQLYKVIEVQDIAAVDLCLSEIGDSRRLESILNIRNPYNRRTIISLLDSMKSEVANIIAEKIDQSLPELVGDEVRACYAEESPDSGSSIAIYQSPDNSLSDEISICSEESDDIEDLAALSLSPLGVSSQWTRSFEGDTAGVVDCKGRVSAKLF